MTEEEGDEVENPTEVSVCSKLTRLLGPPNPSEPGALDRTETSLRIGASQKKMGL